jgi:hypothetical protein
MAENNGGVVVTQRMLTEAARAGDVKSLTVWAKQSVRVTTAEPLCAAVRGGYNAVVRQLEVVRLLVRELGANINRSIPNEPTPLILAICGNNLALVECLVVELGANIHYARWPDRRTPLIMVATMSKSAGVRCLVELGARIGAVDMYGDTAFIVSARNGRYATMQYLLEEAGANMDDVNNDEESVWDKLIEYFEDAVDDDEDDDEEEEEDPLALTGLLRVMVLRSAPPPALVALLSPEPVRVVQEGTRLRARLPAYLAHRRAYLDLRCPRVSLLPGVLRALIYTFEGPATTDELWATGLGAAP